MGHIVEIMIVALIGLAIFGPKALQGMAREAGKTTGQAKILKDKLAKDLSAVTDQLPHLGKVPTNPHQALDMLMKSDKKEQPKDPVAKVASQPENERETV